MGRYAKKDVMMYASCIQNLCGIECHYFHLKQSSFDHGFMPVTCGLCQCAGALVCNGQSIHARALSGLREGQFARIYFCQAGFAFVGGGLMDKNGNAMAGLVAGPVRIAEEDHETPPSAQHAPKTLSGEKLKQLEEMTAAICEMLFMRKGGPQETERNGPYRVKGEVADSELYRLLDNEKQLQTYIAQGDVSRAEQYLQKIIQHRHFKQANNLQELKTRVIELIVLVSRAAIAGGADVNKIFWFNTHYVAEIEQMTGLEALQEWLQQTMAEFMNRAIGFTQNKYLNVMAEILSYIKQHYTEKISLHDISAHVYVSKSHFCKIFKSTMGCSFTTYINKMRVEKCKIYLMDHKYSLVEISSMVGFEDQSYFTRVFKKMVGISPGKFRELRGRLY